MVERSYSIGRALSSIPNTKTKTLPSLLWCGKSGEQGAERRIMETATWERSTVCPTVGSA